MRSVYIYQGQLVWLEPSNSPASADNREGEDKKRETEGVQDVALKDNTLQMALIAIIDLSV